MQRGLRAQSVLLRRDEEGELKILEDETPRTEAMRNDRLSAGVWTAFSLLLIWLAVMLRTVSLAGWLTRPKVGGVGAALCLWRLALALRRLG